MAFDISKLKTNGKKETEGVWCDIPTPDGLLRLRIARIGNPAYQAELDKQLRPSRLSAKLGGLSMGAAEEATIKASARHVLLGWEGLTEDGKEIEYSVETAERLLRIPDFADLVFGYARDAQLFRDETISEVSKN